MRILIACHSFFPQSHAGTETLAKEVGLNLQKLGHEVAILAPKPNYASEQIIEPSMEQESCEGLQVFRFSSPRIGSDQPLHDVLSFRNSTLRILYRDLLTVFKPDILHVFHLMHISGVLLEEAKRSNIPIVFTPTDFWLICPTYQLLNWLDEDCTEHSLSDCVRCLLAERLNASYFPRSRLRSYLEDLETAKKDNPEFENFEKILFERDLYVRSLFSLCDRVLPANSMMKSMLVSRGLIENETPVVPFGAPALINQLFAEKKALPQQSKIHVGFIGTVRRSKGLHVLLEAVEKLPRNHPFTFSIYGTVHEHHYFEQMRLKIRKLPEVHFRGTFPSQEVEKRLSELDLLVIPSIWHENTPLIAYSAMHTKTPVICSDTSGLADAVYGYQGGITFPKGDSAALAGLLLGIIKNPSQIEEWSRRILPVPTTVDYTNSLLAHYETLSALHRQTLRHL
ncbi:MAG: glycosyltransferase [Deltaproteobacteria bacterium]|nr:glycosyltransferase [Deltaproteobacteria bacterium]